MKFALPLVLLLAACSSVPPKDPEDLALVYHLVASTDPLQREEGLYRLSIAGLTILDAAEEKEGILRPLDADTASVRDRIRQVLQEEKTPERQVWRAWHLLRLACLARYWSSVYDALTRQDFGLVEIYEPHDRVKFVRLKFATGSFVNDAGDRHDLFCWVQSVKPVGSPWRVKEVYVGFQVRHNAAFKSIAARRRYGANGVLQQFLDLPDVQKVAAVFPYLEEIELTYGRIRDKAADGAPAGFHVNAGFVMEGNAGGRSVYYTAEANLDPKEVGRGRLDWAGFTPSADVGPLTPRGSGIWGAGGLRPSDD